MPRDATPPLAQRRRTARMAAFAQACAAIAFALVILHVATGLAMPLLGWHLPREASASLVLAWADVRGGAGSAMAPPAQALVAALACVPYGIGLVGLARLWRFFGAARESALPAQAITRDLAALGGLAAGLAIALVVVPALAWLVAVQGSPQASGVMPLRIGLAHLLLLLSALCPVALAAVLGDAAAASEDARSYV